MGGSAQEITAHVTGKATSRKACDFCSAKKRRCDGKGDPTKPCTLCKEYGVTCRYSPRKRYRRNREGGTRGLEVSIPRQPFTASPATGLVGHIENTYMALFMESINPFLAVTCSKTVLGGMTDVMLVTPVQGRVKYSNPSLVSVFWGAIALGSLIGCAPREQTEMYVNKARDSLKVCLEGGSSEVQQALHLMTNLELMRDNLGAAAQYNAIAASWVVTDTTAAEAEADIDPAEVQVMFQSCVLGTATGEKIQSAKMREKAKDEAKVSLDILKQKGGLQARKDQALRTALKATGCIYDDAQDSSDDICFAYQLLVTACEAIEKNERMRKCGVAYVPACLYGGVIALLWDNYVSGIQLLEAGIAALRSTPGITPFPHVLHAIHAAALVSLWIGRHDLCQQMRDIHNKHFHGYHLPDSKYVCEPVCESPRCLRLYHAIKRKQTLAAQLEEALSSPMLEEGYSFDPEGLEISDADHILELLGEEA